MILPERPFRVLGVQQIAIGGLEKSSLRRFWIDLLGLPQTGSFKSDAHNVDEDILRLGSGPLAVEIDLMQPLDPGRSPRVQDPALNHVGLWVDDLRAAVRWLKDAGVRLAGGVAVGAAGHEVCFIHPRGNAESPLSAEGVLVELVQAPARVIAALDSLSDRLDESWEP